MKTSILRAGAAATVALGGILVLGGCSFLEPQPVPTPTPSPTVAIDTTRYIGTVIDPVDTVWSGTDTGGDLTTFTLRADGTVAVSYGDASYDYPGDTWRVEQGVLKIEVYLNETDGLAEYVGKYDQVKKAMDAVMRTTRTAKALTLTLTQQQ